jgi:translation initiation factor 2 beta subunit (eIF-2beta)/eIF-5
MPEKLETINSQHHDSIKITQNILTHANYDACKILIELFKNHFDSRCSINEINILTLFKDCWLLF